MLEQKRFPSTEREPVNNEGSIIFEYQHYKGTILPIRQALIIRPLLEFYSFLIVATLFLLNGFFII